MKPLLTIKTKTIQMSINLSFELNDHDSVLEQLGKVQLKLMRDISQKIYYMLMINIKEQVQNIYPGLGFYDERERNVVTPMGNIKIPDWEIKDKKTKKYIARAINLLGGLDKKKRYLEQSRVMIQQVLPHLSFRKSSKLLGTFWENFSHQRLHQVFKSIPTDKMIRIVRKGLPWSDVERILLYLDGFCVKTRIKQGAELIRDTLRFGVKMVRRGSTLSIQWIYGLLDMSYEKIIDQLITKDEKVSTVVLADGERGIEQAIEQKGLNFQRCLFHFSKNLLSKFVQDGIGKKMAEQYVDQIKSLIFISQKRAQKLGKLWKQVVMNRLDGLHEMMLELKQKKLIKAAQSIHRACPYLFTYIEKFCAGKNGDQKWWIGRTSNPIERPFRCLAYRMKRIGAVWNPFLAMKMISLCLQDYYNLSPHQRVKPLSYSISIKFVKF